MVHIKKSTRILAGGKSVAVKAHERGRDGYGRLSHKTRVEKSFIRLRLRSPRSLRKKGFDRFRTIEPDGKLPGLPLDIKELILREPGSKVVYAFRGDPSLGEGRAQAVLIPRRRKR